MQTIGDRIWYRIHAFVLEKIAERLNEVGFTGGYLDAGHVSGGASSGLSHSATGHTAATLGNILYAAAAGAWTLLAGNTTTTRKFLRQTGTGAVSAAPAWDTLVDGDLPTTLAGKTLTAPTIADFTNAQHDHGDADDGGAVVGGGGGAPTTADYLVGTADVGLSAEIVVGTAPGGELGGTWASPTVDATHSGSSHADIASSVKRRALTGNDTLIASDKAKIIDATAPVLIDPIALAITAAATLGDGWWCIVQNDGTFSVTINPDGAETINTEATLELTRGNAVLVMCTGAAFFSLPVGGLPPGWTRADGGDIEARPVIGTATPLAIYGHPDQSNFLFEVFADESIGATFFTISPGGEVVIATPDASLLGGGDPILYVSGIDGVSGSFQINQNDDGATGFIEIYQPSAAAEVGILLDQNSAAADFIRLVDGSIVARIDKAGRYVTAAHAAPADADVATGEMAIWFDQTNGAAKLMIKAKQADGTVRTGSVSLA